MSLKPLDRIFDYNLDGTKRAIKKAGISYFKDIITNIVLKFLPVLKVYLSKEILHKVNTY
jgi:hypothetical protein